MGLSTPVYIPKRLDTQAKIQAEIDRLGSAGGDVTLAPTTIEVSEAGEATGDTLTTPYAFHLDASGGPIAIRGDPATTIKLVDAAGANVIPILIRGSSATERTAPVLLEDFALDGNEANVTAWTDFGLVTVAYAQNVNINRLKIENNPFGSIVVFRSSERVIVQNCEIYGSAGGETAVRVESTHNSVINNRLYGGSSDLASGLIGLNANTDIGVFPRNSVVMGNLIDMGMHRYGITISGTRGTIVANNQIRNADNTVGAAIYMTHNTLNGGWETAENIIQGNSMYSVRNGVLIANGISSPAVGTRHNIITGNVVHGAPSGLTTPLGAGFQEFGTTNINDNAFTNNIARGATVPFDIKATTSQRLSRGNIALNSSDAVTYRTTNRASATVANGTTSISVSHGLGRTPDAGEIIITPTNNLGSASHWWVDTIGSSSFTINVDSDPGATTATFAWRVG